MIIGALYRVDECEGNLHQVHLGHTDSGENTIEIYLY